MAGCLGSCPFPRTLSQRVAPYQWQEQLWSCFWQHLPTSAHWPRSAVYRGWQSHGSSGSSPSGDASHWISQRAGGEMAEADLAVTRATSITAAFQELRRWLMQPPCGTRPKFLGCMLVAEKTERKRSAWTLAVQGSSYRTENIYFRYLKNTILSDKKNVPLQMSTYI